ncbi:MAG: dephospho-CoA kinase [Dehalococcoidales bacterium]|nr:dephospho-CoA kinase [Dehalococcoidales bacterium]
MTRVIGLTGGIGSGKSTVTSFLAELGATIIDADKIVHEAYLSDTEVWRKLVKTFGEGILTKDRAIDRKKLGEVVFNNPELLEKLNDIVHPAAFRIVEGRIAEARKRRAKMVVVEVPLLFESGWDKMTDEIWTVTANKTNVIRRTMTRTGMTEEQIRARMRSQMSDEERTRRAKVVIDNDGTPEELRTKVKELWKKTAEHF